MRPCWAVSLTLCLEAAELRVVAEPLPASRVRLVKQYATRSGRYMLRYEDKATGAAVEICIREARAVNPHGLSRLTNAEAKALACRQLGGCHAPAATS